MVLNQSPELKATSQPHPHLHKAGQYDTYLAEPKLLSFSFSSVIVLFIIYSLSSSLF